MTFKSFFFLNLSIFFNQDNAFLSNFSSFKEKPQTGQGWINGGFFVIEPEFFSLIKDDNSILEKEPLERVAELSQLVAFYHDGYWQCMDTIRDRNVLQKLWRENNAPWKKWR